MKSGLKLAFFTKRGCKCNFNCLIETGGLLKVTVSHVHCKSDSIPETVQDKDVVTRDH